MTKKLHAALLIDTDAFAGTERHILELARGLRDAGAEASIACPPQTPLEERARAAGLGTIELARQSLLNPTPITTLASKLASGELDLLHAHNGRTTMVAALAVRHARKGAAVATQHFIDPARSKRRGPAGALSRVVLRWVDEQMAHFVAISESVRDAMIERGEDAKKITVVPNGISEPDRAKLKSPTEIRQQFGVTPEVPLIVCCARLEAEKDVGTLIRAMEQVRAAKPNAVCVIAGEGSLAEDLAAQVRAASLEKTVILAGFLQDSLSLIHAADLFVLPSLAEPFGLVLLEAMALGKAVVATRAGGPLEIVENERTGLLVPPGNPVAMSAGILRFCIDPSLAATMGAQGRARFFERFTTAKMARGTLGVYERASAARA